MINIGITLIAGIFFLIGSLIASKLSNKKQLLSFSIGMAITVLIILLIIDIIPESYELINNYKIITIIGGILIGIGILMSLEKIIPHHDHYKEKSHHENHLSHIGIMTSLALIIHNVIEGIGIYGVTLTSLKAGLLYSLGVGMHNIPFGIEITTMFEDNKKKWKYIILLTISSLFGVLIIWGLNITINNFILGCLLSITIGMILYIIFNELLVELKENFNKYSIFGILTGIAIMMIGTLIL